MKHEQKKHSLLAATAAGLLVIVAMIMLMERRSNEHGLDDKPQRGMTNVGYDATDATGRQRGDPLTDNAWNGSMHLTHSLPPGKGLPRPSRGVVDALLSSPWIRPFSQLVTFKGNIDASCSSPHRSERGALFSWPPTCPSVGPTGHVGDELPRGGNIDQDPSWVSKKYKLYASRCARTEGMMWSKLSRRTHDVIADRIANITRLYAAAASIETSSSGRLEKSTLRVLDWASGCGVSLSFFSRAISSRYPSVQLEGLGVDITEAAVQYARNLSLVPNTDIIHCVADGTMLDTWLSPATFDVITSFGGLLHVPAEKMCKTIETLVGLLKGGRVMWAGYIDNANTLNQMLRCRPSCRSEGGGCLLVDVVVVPENKWLRGVGIPSANRRRQPTSVFWVKPEKCVQG